MIVFIVNLGIFVAAFSMFDFALNHFSKEYAGVWDLFARLVLICGILVSTLLMPIWIQKSMNPDIHPLVMVIGMPVGLLVAIFHKKMTEQGKVRWSGKKEWQ